MNKNMQGILVGIIILAVVGFGLWYSQNTSQDVSASGKINYENVDPSGVAINYWYQHTRSREEALTKIIDDFNSNNQWGITVNGSHQGHYGQIFYIHCLSFLFLGLTKHDLDYLKKRKHLLEPCK